MDSEEQLQSGSTVFAGGHEHKLMHILKVRIDGLWSHCDRDGCRLLTCSIDPMYESQVPSWSNRRRNPPIEIR